MCDFELKIYKTMDFFRVTDRTMSNRLCRRCMLLPAIKWLQRAKECIFDKDRTIRENLR